jgi:hypothetical protein
MHLGVIGNVKVKLILNLGIGYFTHNMNGTTYKRSHLLLPFFKLSWKS